MASLIQAKANEPFFDHSRLHLEYLLDTTASHKKGQDIINGLKQNPKTLPPKYFYDSKGSRLFEEICQLPEYYPTRTEASILQEYALDIINITGEVQLIELGSGSSTKTRLLLNAYETLGTPLFYSPIDVSGSILQESAFKLLTDYPTLNIKGIVGTYEQALTKLKSTSKKPKIVLFLGSTIGNFTPQQCDTFIDLLTSSLEIGDYFLLGIDLQKPTHFLESAYNDNQGITAQFNLNMLDHLNQRFQGNFNLNLFQHKAIYNTVDCQIEMYLTSKKPHQAALKNLNLNVNFELGESILTEISRKFNITQMTKYLAKKDLKLLQSYTDNKQWFGVLLCQKQL